MNRTTPQYQFGFISCIKLKLYAGAMRILLVAILLVEFSGSAFSQVPSIFLLSSDSSFKKSNGMIILKGNAMVGSNSLDNLFFQKSFFGGRLENSHLDELAEGMKDQNRAGFILNAGLEFLNFRDTLFNRPEWGLRVDVNTNYHTSVSFSRDLYKLVYRGNSSLIGDTAELGPLSFQNTSWQKFGVGIFNKQSLNSMTISLVEGQNYESLIMSESDFYTSPNSDSLSLSYRGDYLRSDTAKSGLANGSGLGVALDFDYNLPLADHKGVISISLRDFGFVVWNKSSEKISYDSLTTWTGLQVNDIFEFATDTVGFPNLRDSLHYDVKKKSFITSLPASVHLRYCRHFNERDYYEAGLSMWPNKAAVPFVYAGISHFIGDHFIFSERLSYGGYSRFGLGSEVQWMPGGAWLFRLGTNHLGGFTMSSARGRDVYFSLAKTF